MKSTIAKILFFIILTMGSLNGYGQTRSITYSSGTGNFVIPFKTTTVTAEAWGAGGKGGNTTGNGSRAGGGGGGAYSSGSISLLTPIQNLPYQVGAGSTSTLPGGDSFVGSSTTIMAKGGNSVENNTPAGAIGGLDSEGFGSTKYNGGRGANGGSNNGGGGGGSSAGTSAAGNYTAQTSSTNGATAPAGGGNGANGAPSSDNNGTSATQFGGGGGGSSRGNGNSAIDRLGGNGANGQIKITWNCSSSLVSGNPNPGSVCLGTGIGPIVYDFTGATGYSINWTPSVPLGVNVTVNEIAGTVTIQGTPTSGGTFNYTISPTYPANSNGSCSGPGSFTGSFTVNSPPSILSQSTASQTVCSTDSFSPISVSATGTALTYQWFSNTSASNTGGTLISGATSASFTPPITSPGVPVYYYAVISGACSPEVSSAVSGAFTVAPDKSVSVASVSPTLCINTPLSGSTIITHSTTNATGIGTASGLPPGVTASFNQASQTITISGIPTVANTFSYIIPILGCGPAINATGTITVTPNNTVSAASLNDQIVCQNSPITAITHSTSGATGIGAITWSPSNPGGITASFSSNTITISGTPTTPGVYTYSIPLTGGCGTVSATGTIRVAANPATNPVTISSTVSQNRCVGATSQFPTLSVVARQGYSYQWYSNTTGNPSSGVQTPVGTNSNSFAPPNTTPTNGTPLYYYVVVSSASCGTSATSNVSGAHVVNQLPIVSFDSQPSGTACVETNLTYTTQPNQQNYVWTIPGIAETDYAIVSGGTSSSNTLVIRWLSAGPKSVTVNYQDANACGATTAAVSNSITVQKNTVTGPSVPTPTVCYTDRVLPSFTHTTTLATGIANNGVSGANGLPEGISATWSGGTITISGTVAATVPPGIYPYSIPLTGGCPSTTVAAQGTITVPPQYLISTIASVSPSNAGGTAIITIIGNPAILTNGDYNITYNLGLSNSGSETKLVTITNGRGVFSTLPILSEDLTSLTITQIKKTTDPCFVPITTNNETFFGIKAEVYTQNGSFFIPAGIFEITIKVWGGGGGGGRGNNGAGGGGGGYSTRTFAVTPGQQYYVVVGAGGNGQTNSPGQNGSASYVTLVPSDPSPSTSSLVFANGGNAANGTSIGTGGLGSTANGSNGLPGTSNPDQGGNGGNGGGPTGGIGGAGGSGNGNNPGLPGQAPGGGGGGSQGNSDGGRGGNGIVSVSYPLPPVGPCFNVIDDGARTGITIIEFTCDMTWTAPEGLVEFYVAVGGGGGGGGAGSGAGGGGAGGLTFGQFSAPATFQYGLPANTNFDIKVGQGGAGATLIDSLGRSGAPSSIQGTINGVSSGFSAGGGGGGGSQNNINGRNGLNGASGGGGGSNKNPNVAGNAGTGNGDGKNGGAGSIGANTAFAGGGGGGRFAPGEQGKAAGAGQGQGGNGGDGIILNFLDSDTTRYFGAGGGGIGDFFNGTDKIGLGGRVNGIRIGGDGNLDASNAVGRPGRDKTGSGGGAGYIGGGKGGNGVVYIYYEILRILGVEYLYFDAELDQDHRETLLTWATLSENGNSHFEIERAIHDVKTWTKIGEVAGIGYSSQIQEYTFKDKELPASGGRVFYRLRQVSIDSTSSVSPTKAVQVNTLDGNGKWIAYPNPSNQGSEIQVDLLDQSAHADEQILVRIADVRGVFSQFSVFGPQEVNRAVNSYLENKRSGLYIIHLTWGSQTEQIKLVRK